MRAILVLAFLLPANIAQGRGRCPSGYYWNARGLRCQKIVKRLPKAPKPLPIVLDLVKIPAGTFLMGAATAKSYKAKDAPKRKVTISKPLYVGKLEVTRSLWKAVMGWEPYSEKCSDHCPAANMNWLMAIEFCNKLSKLKKATPCYRISGTKVEWVKRCTGFRLLTEAEWEYVARAGDKGDKPKPIEDYAWFAGTAGLLRSSPVLQDAGTRAPNAWGVYDMLGNVFEWVWDFHGPYAAVKKGALVDPRGPGTGTEHVFRGGCYMSPHFYMAYHMRYHASFTHRYKSIGLRIASSKHHKP